jgi:hypothetical protein
LAKSLVKKVTEEAESASEIEAPSEFSDSGDNRRQEVGVRKMLNSTLIKAAMKNRRSTNERKEEDEDSIMIKISEWEEMFELIKIVYVEMKEVVRRLHLISKKRPRNK